MKTRGITIGEAAGFLVFADRQVVPPAFWARLKHEASKAALLEELVADYRAERERLEANGWTSVHDHFAAEARFYRRWVELLHGPQAIWPWERGWTEELVDSYPVNTQQEAACRT